MLVSYVPLFWHPMVLVSDPGDSYFQEGQYVKKALYFSENEARVQAGEIPAGGSPAPHDPALVKRFLAEVDTLAQHLQVVDHL